MHRFFTAQKLEIQTRDIGSGAVSLRTEERHARHLKALEEESLANCFGFKRRCVLSEKLTDFNVTTGFPPAIEVALCLSVFTAKKYFTLFPFKGTDKANCPHPVLLTKH